MYFRMVMVGCRKGNNMEIQGGRNGMIYPFPPERDGV